MLSVLAFRFRAASDVSRNLASVPPACGDADTVASEPCGYARCQGLPVAGQGAAVPL
jgi:hypothetical protein